MPQVDWAGAGSTEVQVSDGVLWLAATRRQQVAALGLDSVAAAFAPEFAHVLRELPDRSNGVLLSPDGLLFLKRHGPAAPPPGQTEWEHIWQLAACDVPTAEPICAGVDRDGRSFLITAGIEGEPLDDVLRSGRPELSVARAVIAELAAVTARLHGGGLCHRDYYLCHLFFCPEEPSGQQLRLIDLQRIMSTGRWRPARWRIKDLAALGYSGVGLPIHPRERLRFFLLYLRGLGVVGTRTSTRRFLRQIDARIQRLVARHGVQQAPPPRRYRELLEAQAERGSRGPQGLDARDAP